MTEREYVVAVTLARVNAALQMLREVYPAEGIIAESQRNEIIGIVEGWSQELRDQADKMRTVRPKKPKPG